MLVVANVADRNEDQSLNPKEQIVFYFQTDATEVTSQSALCYQKKFLGPVNRFVL